MEPQKIDGSGRCFTFFLGGGFQVAAVVLMVEEIRDQLTSWGNGSWNLPLFTRGFRTIPGGSLGILKHQQ